MCSLRTFFRDSMDKPDHDVAHGYFRWDPEQRHSVHVQRVTVPDAILWKYTENSHNSNNIGIRQTFSQAYVVATGQPWTRTIMTSI